MYSHDVFSAAAGGDEDEFTYTISAYSVAFSFTVGDMSSEGFFSNSSAYTIPSCSFCNGIYILPYLMHYNCGQVRHRGSSCDQPRVLTFFSGISSVITTVSSLSLGCVWSPVAAVASPACAFCSASDFAFLLGFLKMALKLSVGFFSLLLGAAALAASVLAFPVSTLSVSLLRKDQSVI